MVNEIKVTLLVNGKNQWILGHLQIVSTTGGGGVADLGKLTFTNEWKTINITTLGRLSDWQTHHPGD